MKMNILFITDSKDESPSWEADNRQLVKKLSDFYAVRMLIITFTKAHHWIIFWASWIQSTPYFFKIQFNIILVSMSTFPKRYLPFVPTVLIIST
jgi:hypothetical protein